MSNDQKMGKKVIIFSSTMKKILIPLLFILFVGLLSSSASPFDSLGMKTIENRQYIIHEVESGETFYSLSRRYGTDVKKIMKANPDAVQGLQTGVEIRIPYLQDEGQTREPGRIVHIVQPGETLFGISRKYEVSVAQIKEWNSLRSNTLAIGDKLLIFTSREEARRYDEIREKRDHSGKIIHVVNEGETLFSIADSYDITTMDIKDWNRLDDDLVYIGQELVVGFTGEEKKDPVFANELTVPDDDEEKEIKVKKKDREASVITRKRENENLEKVTEKGIARVIEGSEETKKYLALHRTAPIGTIMQVKNDMNDLSVFVRVIGKLPDTGENRNVLVKISKTAYERLGAYDSQFPVEVVYHP